MQTNGDVPVGGSSIPESTPDQKKIQELTEMSKRALADLANFKKRAAEEKASLIKSANFNLIFELLPVLDNFRRALNQLHHLPPEFQNHEWVKGVSHIERQLWEILQKQGVSELPSPVGKPLNPHEHEAVSEGPGEKNVILEELDKGYIFGDRIIRPTKVKVGDGL